MASYENKFEMLLGFVVVTILGYVIYLSGAWVYHQFFPAPSVSLAMSAWFEPYAPSGTTRLHIAGDVFENGKAATQNRLRLSVEDLKKGNRQSVFLDLKAGHFASDEQFAFRSFMPGDRLHIRAEYSKGDTSITEDIYLGARIPFVTMPATLIILGLFALALLGFLWLFTGPPLPGKNTGAIMISYVIMLAFLAFPLALPSVISIMSPDIVAAMRDAPVGVLVADPKQGDLGRQWVMNIGGAVSQVAISPQPPKQDNAAPSPEPTPTTASDPVKQIDPSFEIQGGLVVPFYVLILSVIGAAINMTLKLPDFQREATSFGIGDVAVGAGRAVVGALSATKQSVSAMFKKTSKEQMPHGAPATPPASQAEDATTPQAQIDSPPPANQAGSSTETPEQRLLRQTSEWRKGLITQHMYLLSAPFLAIVVYYLLIWLKLLQQPALVLVSFSVGLISDKIVGKITGVASGIVGASRSESPSDAGSTKT